MTLHFLTEFRSTSTCVHCKTAPAEGRKTCPRHLAYARAKFREWSRARTKQGLCLACDRRGYRGECRCLLHKGVNQQRCRTWMQSNADWRAFKDVFEKFWLKLDAICRYCRRARVEQDRVGCTRCMNRLASARRPGA